MTASCPQCGTRIPEHESACDLCSGTWETRELRFAALPLEKIHERIRDWPTSLPFPTVLAIESAAEGLRVRMHTAPGQMEGAAAAWASLTRQHSRWVKSSCGFEPGSELSALSPIGLLPVLAAMDGDPFLAAAAGLRNLQAAHGRPVTLYLCVFEAEDTLQERLRSLFAYATGTEKGVEDDTPNPWALRLALWRGMIAIGTILSAVGGAALAPGWLTPAGAILIMLSGALIAVCGFVGMIRWMHLRSLPGKIVEPRMIGSLLRVGVALATADPQNFHLISGRQSWKPLRRIWPDLRRYAFPLPAADLARLIAPLESAEGSNLFAQDAIDDVPVPDPSPGLKRAPVLLGKSAGTGEKIGIDHSGHLLVSGGSRTGKSSAMFALFSHFTAELDDAPGIFLVDPHNSLADAFLHHIDTLPEADRAAAIQRLRIITPHSRHIVPLNLLTLPDFNQAGSALIQSGRRIWGDYWGPRMQAALLSLCRLAHAWNRHHPEKPMGLIHAVFAAYDVQWRKKAADLLEPESRMTSPALDALLGQAYGGPQNTGWVTEVISPILSKVMALELSPWLFSALHAPHFVDLESWVREKAWIVLRLPSGEMGRDAARLTAGMVYNIFEAGFRRVTTAGAVPFDFIIDETQEIGAGMDLENLLSEGGKFGARVSVLTQSLSMLRQQEGFEPVVQALLANTSAQLFFSPDVEDAELLRATLSLDERYGPTTMDIPSLHAWLRARLSGRWQPPTMIRVDPLPRPDPERVSRLIDEVIRAHPEAYIEAEQANSQFQAPGLSRAEGKDSGVDSMTIGSDPNLRPSHAARRKSPDPRNLGW